MAEGFLQGRWQRRLDGHAIKENWLVSLYIIHITTQIGSRYPIRLYSNVPTLVIHPKLPCGEPE